MADQRAGKLLDGVFAINKPQGISSAQVLRDLQTHFDPSQLFAPTIAAEAERLQDAARSQPGTWRRKKQQNKLRQVKIGHGGTLDPLATGVLITGIGSGTKSLQNFLGCTKSYEATVLFGVATDTYDILGKVVQRRAFQQITKQKVLDKLAELKKMTTQRPPIYSALRHQGKRFYEYAREGKELPIDIPERPVEVRELEMVEWYEPGQHSFEWPKEEIEQDLKDATQKALASGSDGPGEAAPLDTKEGVQEASGAIDRKRGRAGGDESVEEEPATKKQQLDGQLDPESQEPLMSGALPANEGKSQAQDTDRPAACKIRMTVSSGFYVRSLCHDLGQALGSAALMATLVRSRQQNFELGKNVFEYSDLEKGEQVWGPRVEELLLEWRSKSSDAEDSVPSSPPRYETTPETFHPRRGQHRSQQNGQRRERRRNSSSDES